MFYRSLLRKYMSLLVATALVLSSYSLPVFANQIVVNFTEDAIGALGDYEKTVAPWEFATDVQVQRSETTSLIGNASVAYNFGAIGIKPFLAYNKDDLGGILDAGGVVNFSIAALDISAGASFRGANPTADAGLDGFDGNGNAIKYFTEDPSNSYQLPSGSNINGVFQTSFEKWRVETALTAYVPITQRDVVPVVLISRSQTSIELAEGLGLALVVDTRTYLHADGAALSFTPMGSVVYKF